MKKRILALILALSAVLCGCGVPAAQDSVPADTTAQAEAVMASTPAEETTEATTEETTIPEATEPADVVEFRESWTSILAGREMTAQHYFVYDCQTETFLTLSGDETEHVYPASVTKLFSAYIALQYIEPNTVITAGSELDLIPGDASVAGLEKGDTLSVAQLVEGMLLPSGNDATFVLATAVGRILTEDPELEPQAAIDRFVEQMNIHAQILGLTGTHFVTPDGMHDENHYTCMADLAKIGKLAMEDPIVSHYAAVYRELLLLDVDRALEWRNSNILLNPESDYYCPFATGLKTGFTTPAGNCLLSSFSVNGQDLVIGVFGCAGSYDRYAETLLLFAQTFGLDLPQVPPAEPTDSSSAATE